MAPIISLFPDVLSIEKPKYEETLVYNEKEQSPKWINYDSRQVNIGGDLKATNSGTYTTTFTLRNGYVWNDGTSDIYSVTWSIEKAPNVITVSPTALELNKNALTGIISVTKFGDGIISAVSSDTDVVNVEIDGTTIIVNSVNKTPGKVMVTIRVSEGTNYKTSEDKAVSVSAVFVALPPIGTALDECTWEQISAVSDAGLASSYWSIGDMKTIHLKGKVGEKEFGVGSSYYCYIIGIDHNSEKEGTNRIHFHFGKHLNYNYYFAFVDSYNTTASKTFGMQYSADGRAIGGWESSYARNTLCTEFKNALPSDLQTVLKPVTKYSDNVADGLNAATSVTATTEEVFLLSEYEVLGTRSYANSAEQNYQERYAYFTGSSVLRYKDYPRTEVAKWWLRSVRGDNNKYFCCINNSGKAGMDYPNMSLGFAPAFCV